MRQAEKEDDPRAFQLCRGQCAPRGDYSRRPQALGPAVPGRNGGNISVRLARTSCSARPPCSARLTYEVATFCLSDLNGKILAAIATLTSELLLHLEIYKATPGPGRSCIASAHATAFAMRGRFRPTDSFRSTRYSSAGGRCAL